MDLEIILINPIKLLNCFLVVGAAMFLIAFTLSGKDIILCQAILNPRYSSLFLVKKNFLHLL